MKVKPRVGPLAIELAVVVLGVLIALAADSWWEGKVETQRAIAYLNAVEADMAEAVLAVEPAVACSERQFRQVGEFNDALNGPVEGLGSVSVPWSALNCESGRPFFPTGTLDALLSTGDINLLSEDVRLLLVRENAEIRARLAQVDRFDNVLLEAYADLELAYQQMVVAGDISAGYSSLTALDVARSPVMRQAWSRFENVYFNKRSEWRHMLEAVRRIQTNVTGARR